MLNKIFVYGTLLPGEPNARLLAGINFTTTEDTMTGDLYDAGAFPFAILAGTGPAVIHGAVYSFAPEIMEAVLSRLDELEGYYAPGNPSNLYDRVEVTTGKGERVYVYETSPRRRATITTKLPRIPGGSWVEYRKLRAVKVG